MADRRIATHFTYKDERPHLTIDMLTSLVCSLDLSNELKHMHHMFQIPQRFPLVDDAAYLFGAHLAIQSFDYH